MASSPAAVVFLEVAVNRRLDGSWWMLRSILRFLGWADRPAVDRCVIDMQPYRDSIRRLDEDLRAAAASQERVAGQVRQWALDCISGRSKAPLPTRLPKNCSEVILSWLDGLFVAELYQITRADRLAILHHLYGEPEDRLADVRAVQTLRPTTLVFPTPVQVVDPQSLVGAGGGPKVRRYR
jgi:hypothetical protein